MAVELQMNHLTVRRGLADLESRGVIEKRRNVGNFVVARPMAAYAIVLPNFVVQGHSPHPYFSHVVTGIQSTLDPRTSATSVLSYRSGHLWEDIGSLVLSRGISGIVLGPGADVTIEQVEKLLAHDIKIVLIKPSNVLAPLGLTSVEVDTTNTLAQLMNGIYARGHRNVAFAYYETDPLLGQEIEVVRTVCRRWGITNFDAMKIGIPSDETSIDYSVLRQIFKYPERPTAVVVHDEFAAAAMFRLCYELKIRVPDDISVAAILDSTPQLHPVPLTAGDSAVAGRELGRLAAERLMGLVSGKPQVERLTCIRSDIQWNASLATLNNTNR